jgi:ABC-type sugar transport system ATPase subunit
VSTIRLDQLTKVHPDGTVAVDAIDLEIADGEFFVLMGPSGCGKTSVLRMIAGLDEPTAGDVLIDGVSVRDVPTQERHVGMLFQSSALYPHMTVRQNLAFPLVVAKTEHHEIDRRVAEMAELVGLTSVLDVRPRRLSGGMQQRVAMGRALMRRPPLLLMDEPMSNLDAKLRTELRAHLAALQRWSGATTVHVTHDQVEAMALADRAAVMRSGRIVQCGPPGELYRQPVDLFVATFVGSPPMNVVSARLELDVDHAGERRLVADVGPQRLDLGDPSRWPGVEPRVGRRVALGIRPGDFALRDRPGDDTLPVEIIHAEHVGVERHLTATLDARGVRVTDGTDADGGRVIGGAIGGVIAEALPPTTVTVAVGDDVAVDLWRPVHLAVDLAAVQLFDLPSGRRIAAGDQVAAR